MTSLEVKRGNTADYLLTVSDDNGVKNINGYSFYFTVKKNTNELSQDDDSTLLSKYVLATSEVGLLTISLTSSDTLLNPASYMYDIKIKNPAGTWVKSSSPDKFIVNGVVKNG
jgi:hypothetical protein